MAPLGGSTVAGELFLRFLCRARPSRLPLPCRRGFEEWEEPGVDGGVASGESGSFFTSA